MHWKQPHLKVGHYVGIIYYYYLGSGTRSSCDHEGVEEVGSMRV